MQAPAAGDIAFSSDAIEVAYPKGGKNFRIRRVEIVRNPRGLVR
jgi:hypothetical protein